MRIVIAPDSFKGCLTARKAAEAIAQGARLAQPDADIHIVPMADGGDGTLDVLVHALVGTRRKAAAHGPLGEPIEAPVGLIREASTAIIEVASIAGYAMVPLAQRNPLKTTTYGVGEVIRAVVESEMEDIILALGGSATVDGGVGMIQALGWKLLDHDGRELPKFAAGGDLTNIDRIICENPPAGLENVNITIASDVLNPACGPSGAAVVFGPQKGADPKAVRMLDLGLAHWAGLLEKVAGRPLRDEPGTGAAGGLALPLLAFTNAAIVPGVDLVIESTRLAERIAAADLVITGEGRLDAQSLMGKVVGAVGRLCRSTDVPCVAIAGITGPGAENALDILDAYFALDGPIEETESRLAAKAEDVARRFA